MIKLTLTEKNGEPRLLTFDKDEITIGRVSGNDIVLAKGNVSKKHSRFTVKSPGQIEVADLKSTNGTYVNGRKIGSPMLLSASDRVYVGDFLISIDLGGGVALDAVPGDFPATGSAARRLPIPPPPPPPRAGGAGSSSARLPTEDAGTTAATTPNSAVVRRTRSSGSPRGRPARDASRFRPRPRRPRGVLRRRSPAPRSATALTKASARRPRPTRPPTTPEAWVCSRAPAARRTRAVGVRPRRRGRVLRRLPPRRRPRSARPAWRRR